MTISLTRRSAWGIAGLFLFVALCQADDLILAAADSSTYAIAMAATEDPEKTAEAAELLQWLVAESTGAELPIYPEAELPLETPAIYLGTTEAARRHGLVTDDIEGWAYRLAVRGQDIFLVGQDVPGWGGYTFNGYAGSLKAVTAFMEQVAGVRFVLPGRLGIHIPRQDPLTVPVDLAVNWSPPIPVFVGRRVSAWPGKQYDPYAIANNFFPRYANDSELFWAGGSHTWPHFVPREKWYESHPEYFALVGKSRDYKGRGILCLSQPAVKDLLVEGVVAKMDEGYQMVMLGQSDGYAECRCEQCQAIHPEIGEKLWIFHRELAERIMLRRPDKQVVLLSYVWASTPPKTFDSFPDNVVIMNNRFVEDYFEAWQDFKTPRMVYFPLYLRMFPHVPPRYAVDLVRLWQENDVVGLYMGGGLDSVLASWGLDGPSYYALGQALGDPSRDADEVEREFVTAAYGEAAGPMLDFFTTMHRRLEVRALFDRRDTGIPDRQYRGYPFASLPGDYLCHFFAPEIVRRMAASLDAALEVATEPPVKARLELVEAEFRYLEARASLAHSYRAYQAAPSWAALEMVEERVQKVREVLAWVQPDGEARNPGGVRQLRTPFSTGWPVKRTLQWPDSAPFSWDFVAIRELGELPEVEVDLKVRGGQSLRPYVPVRGVGSAPADAAPPEQDGFDDPTIDAPFDQ